MCTTSLIDGEKTTSKRQISAFANNCCTLLTASEKKYLFFCLKIWTIEKPALYLYP